MKQEITKSLWDGSPREHKRIHKDGRHYLRKVMLPLLTVGSDDDWVEVFWRR